MPIFARTTQRSRRIGIVAIALAGVVALAGCASPEEEESSAPKEGGVLTVGDGPGVLCVDPQQIFQANTAAISRNIVDSLTDQNLETGEIVPWLAESWEINDDASEYTFHLREDVSFSDGTPFNAENMKANMDFIKGLGAKSSRGAAYLNNYAETVVDDEFTATVKFSKPAAHFLVGSSTLVFSMLSNETMTKTPEARCQGDLVGTGAFTLKEFTQDQGASLVRRDDYAWPSELAEHKGKAYLEGIDFVFQPVPNVRAGALASGQTDVAMGLETQDLAQVEASDATIEVGKMPGLPGSMLVNTARPVVSDKAVRQAILIGFDRGEIVNTVLGEYYTPATSVMTSNLPQYVDSSEAMKYDPKKAKKILDDAGWKVGSDGIREKDGQRLTFAMLYTEDFGAFYTSLLQLMQQQLKDIGMEATLDNVTVAGLTERQTSKNYDMAVSTLTESDPTMVRNILQLFTPAADLEAAGLTPLFATEQGIADPEERKELFAELQKIVLEEGFALPIFEGAQITGVSPDVTGVRYDFKAYLNFYDTAFVK
jgi:peptide/nickel transport system substrate-binding protein